MKRRTAVAKKSARAQRIFNRLRGARGLDEDELWQHALFLRNRPTNDAV